MRVSASRFTASALLAASLAVLNLSCGNGGRQARQAVGPAMGNAYVFFGDAPPSGTSILKFEITLSSAALCPQVSPAGECQGAQASLISSPVDIELEQLELESAFLSLRSVAAGTYGGAKLTFANPELKILRLDGTVQELESPALQLNPTTITPTFLGGLTLTADSNFGFLVDFNLSESIQSSGNTITGISPVVNLVKLSAAGQAPMEELEDTTGKVSNLTKTCPTGSFTLIDSLTGLSIASIRFDSSTEFDDLTCETLANDLVVEADVELRLPTQQSAEFFAEEVELVNPADEGSLEGVVFQVNGPTQFVLLVQGKENLPDVPSGSFVTVSADPARVLFRIDADDLPVESSMFSSGADLLAGQTLEVDVASGSMVVAPTGCAAVADNCTASAEKLKLKKGSTTGRVALVSDPNFTLDQLPSLFGNASTFRPLSADCQACLVGSILVTTSSATVFEDGLSGVSSLAVNNIVTVRGLLLKDGFVGPSVGTGSPQLVAEKVRRRPS